MNTDISQGSVATQLRCGEILKHEFVANLPLSLAVQNFENRLTHGGSYEQPGDVEVGEVVEQREQVHEHVVVGLHYVPESAAAHLQ